MEFEVDIRADNMDNLYGLQIHLSFDKSQLEIVEFKPEFFGWKEDDKYWEYHRWDNNSGTFDMVFTCYGSDLFFSGSGKLGTIKFRVTGTAAQLKITENIRYKPDRACIGVDNEGRLSRYNVYQVTIHNDNIPPEIDNIEVINNSTIRIEFNEPLDEESALDLNNYIISPDLEVRSVHLDESKKNITLQTGPQVGNRLYELTILDIRDLIGNKNTVVKSFRGAMKLWLEAVDPIYNRNTGSVKLKAGPVENMTQLKFYITYDDDYLKYEGIRFDSGSFNPQINTGQHPPHSQNPLYMYFYFMLNPVQKPVNRYDNWDVCEFDFLPQNTGSTMLEFMTDYRPPVADGQADGKPVTIVVEYSDEMIDILPSYHMTGFIKMVGQNDFYNVQAYLLGDDMKKLTLNVLQGSFELNYLIPGTYTVRLSKPGFLTMDYSIDVEGDTVEELHMIAGDLNDNLKIDITDIAIICKKFSTKKGEDGWDQRMDYNADGWIDIVDISIVARNYGIISNVTG
jgi:hypothetical protein